MKEKRTYETLEMEICTFEEDIVTMSNDWQDQYDDKGTWKDTWFN